MEKKFLIGQINKLIEEHDCPTLKVSITEDFIITAEQAETSKICVFAFMENGDIILEKQEYDSYIDFMTDLREHVDAYFYLKNKAHVE